jgi:hypothetical protein
MSDIGFPSFAGVDVVASRGATMVGHTLLTSTEMLDKHAAQFQSHASQQRDTRPVGAGQEQDLTGRDPQPRDGPLPWFRKSWFGP